MERSEKVLAVDRALDAASIPHAFGGGDPVHFFFSDDTLHAEMPNAVRQVPFTGTTIPIVSPEHLVIRKALLDRPKDWPDIEAILRSTNPLDTDAIESWLRRLAGDDDPRVTKLRDNAG